MNQVRINLAIWTSLVLMYRVIGASGSTSIYDPKRSINCDVFNEETELEARSESYDDVLIIDPVKRYLGPVCGNKSPRELIADLERSVETSKGGYHIDLSKQPDRGKMRNELAIQRVRAELNRHLTSITNLLDRSKVDNTSAESIIKSLMKRCAKSEGICSDECIEQLGALKSMLMKLCSRLKTTSALLLADVIKMSLRHQKHRTNMSAV